MRNAQTGYHHDRAPNDKANNWAIDDNLGLDLGMRTFAVFLLLFALAAVVSGLLTYPVWAALQTFADVPIHRVMNRIGMLILAIATVMFLRQRGLADRASLGYALPRRQFVRQMLVGFAAGILLMMPLAVSLFGFDLRELSAKFLSHDSPGLKFADLAFEGLLTGFTVAFLEETFCRGAMYTAIKRDSGLFWAFALPTLFYAATHFLGGRLRLPADQIDYWSGLQVTANLFERFVRPLEFADSFIALCALGLLLSLIRHRTKAIAGCVGLHAGGVLVIVVMRNMSTVNADAPLGWLVGSYDGVIGWMAAGWIALVTFVYWRMGGKQTAVEQRTGAQR